MSEQTELIHPTTGEVVEQRQQSDDPLTRFVEHVVAERMGEVVSDDALRRKFIEAATLAVAASPQLMDASANNPESFAASIVKAVSVGLSVDPAMGEGYLVPVWDKHRRANVIGLWLGYKGLRKLALRDPDIVSVYADVVYHGDRFEWQTGTEHSIIHQRNIDADGPPLDEGDKLPSHIRAAYAVATLANGDRIVRVLARWELADAREHALTTGKKRKTFGPWHSHAEAMCSKTALRRLLTRDVPLRADLSEVLAHETSETPSGGARRVAPVVTPEASGNDDISARLDAQRSR